MDTGLLLTFVGVVFAGLSLLVAVIQLQQLRRSDAAARNSGPDSAGAAPPGASRGRDTALGAILTGLLLMTAGGVAFGLTEERTDLWFAGWAGLYAGMILILIAAARLVFMWKGVWAKIPALFVLLALILLLIAGGIGGYRFFQSLPGG